MNAQFFDSNILIDFLQGNLDAIAVIDACERPVISKIAHMEVMVGCKHAPTVAAASPDAYDEALAKVENHTRNWINVTFKVIPITDEVADFSIEVRKQTHQKLPDTVIHATAILSRLDIVTRNPKDFQPLPKVPAPYKNVHVVVPYVLPTPGPRRSTQI